MLYLILHKALGGRCFYYLLFFFFPETGSERLSHCTGPECHACLHRAQALGTMPTPIEGRKKCAPELGFSAFNLRRDPGLVKCTSSLSRSELGRRFCISDQLPGEAHAASPQQAVRAHNRNPGVPVIQRKLSDTWVYARSRKTFIAP